MVQVNAAMDAKGMSVRNNVFYATARIARSVEIDRNSATLPHTPIARSLLSFPRCPSIQPNGKKMLLIKI